MKAQDLKNSVLQLAIQGKLVEQNPNDEPASILLEKIRAEKEELIKEKKIKREKPLPKISEGEKPFEIPDTWEWIRLSEIAWLGDGRKIENTNLPYLEVKYLRGSKEAELKDKGKFIEKGQLVILVDGENSGEVFVVGENGYLGSTFKVLNYSMDIYWEYLMWLLRCYQDKFKNNKTGSTIPHLNKTLFKNLPVGLPPLEEQKRIVAKIEEVLEKIEEYDKSEKELSELEKAFPQDMKKSILQYAIQGKLVEQNPNDEPASVLLEKIKAEKEQLIKEKKIKREKPLPEISEEEKPFEIPNGWEWGYISDIAFVTKLAGFEYTKYIAPNLLNEGIPLFKGKNVQNGRLVYEFESFISKDVSDSLPRSKVNRKCLLTPYVGTIGNIAIFEGDMDCHLGSNVGKIEIFNSFETKILEEYLLYYLRSEVGYKQLTKHKKATAQESISIEAIRNCIIAIPPIEEQKRIVKEIDNLMSYVARLQNTIDNQGLLNKLVQAKTIEIEEKKELVKN